MVSVPANVAVRFAPYVKSCEKSAVALGLLTVIASPTCPVIAAVDVIEPRADVRSSPLIFKGFWIVRWSVDMEGDWLIKASLAIEVTEFGIITEVSLFSANNVLLITVIEFGMTTEVSWFKQNTHLPSDVTEFGIFSVASWLL
jgi:hypothetical protein